ncbi:MAG: sensor domain-containing diguanylate cyclase [Lachnospiraceae bacterium]|nr:sensor domain-containing diguanylate cyclase [Lachnospiraceae bacterium]
METKENVEELKPISVVMPIIIIAMVIFVMVVYTYIERKNLVEDIEQVTNQMAEYVAGSISNEMGYAKSSIRLAATSVSQAMTSENIEAPVSLIAPMIENSPFGGIEYIQADGMNVMNIGEPFDASDRVYYIEGMKGNTGIWNNYNPKTSKETLMNFYTPIIYEGKISGVLTGYIAATSQLSPLFETNFHGQTLYGIMVDENDMVICSTLDAEYEPNLTFDKYMDYFDIVDSEKARMHEELKKATEEACSYVDPSGEGRVSIVKIPGTDWKILVGLPETSFNAIVNKNAGDSVIAIFVISLILISYAGAVLFKNMKRRREILEMNAKLEEENRIYNEENQRAFKEISSIQDIIASANMGVWQIELVDGEEPRMYVNATMRSLLGIVDREDSPEATYRDWFDNITPKAVTSVLESVDKMKRGLFSENTYLWVHPTKGERYVRCGGTSEKIPGGYRLGGYHYDVDEVVREDLAKVSLIQNALNEKNDYYNILGMLASVYNSLHVMDLTTDTVETFSSDAQFEDVVNAERGAAEKVAEAVMALIPEEYREQALEFTDLSTLADRMRYKNHISIQVVSNRIGWFLASFIALERDTSGRLTKAILTTQGIDEKKKEEEQLIYKSRTDELTGLSNRRAYEEDFYEQNDFPAKDYFVSMSLDVNGLKVVNDTLGHAAGDELLIGASQCMKRSFGQYGKLYRTGGDEFIAILFCDGEKLKEVLADFDETVARWKGVHVEKLTIAYGYVSREEEPTMSVRELAALADKRMYAAKSAYYRRKGVDRRGHQDAHKALCELYTKILKINITNDTYQIVNMDASEKIAKNGLPDKLSTWMLSFGTARQVHPDDLKEFLEKTDFKYISKFFAEGKTDLHIIYRRKYGDDYKRVMMEIIPASDYSDENQSFYLYVKDIDG